MSVLALDIGGTKLAAGLVDLDGRLVWTARTPTPPGADAEALWDALLTLATDAPFTAIGVGCGGPMRWPEGVVSPLNIPGWRDFPLAQRLAAHFRVPVRVHNDAICFAVAEHWRGAGRGHDDMLGMVVSTGVGGGLVLGGRLHDGATGNAGHIGHVVVDPAGPSCTCGGRGCLEAVARGPAVVAWALERGWRDPAPSGVALVDAARRGDRVATAALARAGTAIGVALASTVALLDLELVCVGGGLAAAEDLLLHPLGTAYVEHAGVPYARAPRVVPATLEHPGLIGAAALVLAADAYWHGG